LKIVSSSPRRAAAVRPVFPIPVNYFRHLFY
jgi:hypothetical protein